MTCPHCGKEGSWLSVVCWSHWQWQVEDSINLGDWSDWASRLRASDDTLHSFSICLHCRECVS